ncbi:hypothetical protein [Streptomyces sp. NPDC001404]|uniref:DUF7739 domain-containing protein n=1 Tax=Streptomyces sp. NPDC001404 TaxID=3364571 RepID=UPI003698ADC5
MGIRFSHCAAGTRSALTISSLGEHLAHVLPARDWRKISKYFGGGLPNYADIPPHAAGQIGDTLLAAADHRLMPADWGGLAREIGMAAKTAAAAGEAWEWR